jgi:hypothetical protein
MLDGEPLPRHGCTPHHLVETPVPSLRQRRRLTQPGVSASSLFGGFQLFNVLFRNPSACPCVPDRHS